MKNLFCSEKRPFFGTNYSGHKSSTIHSPVDEKIAKVFLAQSPTKLIGIAFYSKFKNSSFIPLDTTISVSTPLWKIYRLKIRENCASNFMFLSSKTPRSNPIEDRNAILTTLPEAICQKSENICSHSERNVLKIL